jgi:hypothetical protein
MEENNTVDNLATINVEFDLQVMNTGELIHSDSLTIPVTLGLADHEKSYASLNVVALTHIGDFIKMSATQIDPKYLGNIVSLNLNDDTSAPWIELKKITYNEVGCSPENIRIFTDRERATFFLRSHYKHRDKRIELLSKTDEQLCELAIAQGGVDWTNKPRAIMMLPMVIRDFLKSVL